MKSLTKWAVTAGLWAAGVGGLGAGCSVSSETKPPEGPLYPNVSAFCSKLAELVCNDLVVRACYGSTDESLVEDREECVAAYQNSARCQPSTEYHAEGAEACLAAWQNAYADAAIDAEEIGEAEETCLGAFYESSGIANMACVHDSECDAAAGLECVVHEGQAEGTCQELVEVGAGAECGEIDQLCEEGFFCDAENGNYCHARRDVGEECSLVEPIVACVESALCVDADPVPVCDAKRDNNDDCAEDAQCANGLCNKGTGDAEGVCAGNIPLYQNGAVCDDFR